MTRSSSMVYAQAIAVPAASIQYSKGSYGRAPVTPVVARLLRFSNIAATLVVASRYLCADGDDSVAEVL